MHLLLRLRRLWRGAEAEDGGLLRVLLLRVGSLPSSTSRPIVLPRAGKPMSSNTDGTTGCADWARGTRGWLIWGIPAAILVISPEIGTRYLVIVWPTLLAFMGAACLLNARRCGRIHCYATGPFFLLLAGVALLYGIGVLPLGANGWSTLCSAFVIGGVTLCCVPEWILGRYRSS